MKTRTFQSNLLKGMLALFAAATMATFSTLGADDFFSRTGKTDIYASGLFLTKDNFHIYGGTLGVGYNFNDYLNLNLEAGAGSLDARNAGGTAYSGMVNFEYNILKRCFTPFITVGAGFLGYEVKNQPVWFLSNVPQVDAVVGGGAGLRWDVTDRFFVKAAYRALRINGGPNDGLAHNLTVGLGISF
jgi:opacity protein-like surface antigen